MADTSLYVTEQPAATLAEGDDTCDLEMKKTYEIIPCIICSIGLLLGLIYCFLGYRCFKMVMFLSGFVFGSAAVFLLYHKEPVLGTQLGLETRAGIGLGVGVLCGLVTMLVCTMGLFLTGLQLGCLLTLAGLLVIGQFCSPPPVWAPLGALLATSVVCALFTLQWPKAFTVIATSAFGATAVTACVDYLAEASRLAGHARDLLSQVPPPGPLCWFSWAIAGVCPALSLMGALVQWKLTARGASHTKPANKKHQQPLQTTRLRYGASGRRRRKPPTLKRYAGDVLAPSYLQSLRERQMGTGSSTDTSLSTAKHTVVDYDFDTGSMVPLTASSPVITV